MDLSRCCCCYYCVCFCFCFPILPPFHESDKYLVTIVLSAFYLLYVSNKPSILYATTVNRKKIAGNSAHIHFRLSPGPLFFSLRSFALSFFFIWISKIEVCKIAWRIGPLYLMILLQYVFPFDISAIFSLCVHSMLFHYEMWTWETLENCEP